jgi:hypothetical protein
MSPFCVCAPNLFATRRYFLTPTRAIPASTNENSAPPSRHAGKAAALDIRSCPIEWCRSCG